MSDGNGLNGKENGKRDWHGRFTPGCAPGPGRPPKTAEQAYLEKWREKLTLENFGEIAERLLAHAKDEESPKFIEAVREVFKHSLPAVAEKVSIEADIHTTETHVHVIAEKAQHDSGFRSRLIALDDELRVGPTDGHAEPGAPGANSN